MEVIYALVPLLGGWLVYGLIASLFLKRASSRDYLLLISSGLVGGLIGGSIGKQYGYSAKPLVDERSYQNRRYDCGNVHNSNY